MNKKERLLENEFNVLKDSWWIETKHPELVIQRMSKRIVTADGAYGKIHCKIKTSGKTFVFWMDTNGCITKG